MESATGTLTFRLGMIVRQEESASKKALVLGVPVDALDMSATLSRIEALIAERTPSMVITVDATGVIIANENPEFMALLNSAALVTPDSAGVVWALRRQGLKLRQVSGVEILAKLCGLSADRGYRLAFLGSAPGVAELAAERLRLKYPGCNIVYTRHGFFPPDSDEVVATEIAEARPDVLFVAMGMPRQEQFIAKTMAIHQAPVSIGVGGSLDVFSGKTRRAPKIFQKLRLEWLWRLMLNPRKIGKVKTLPRFAWKILRSR